MTQSNLVANAGFEIGCNISPIGWFGPDSSKCGGILLMNQCLGTAPLNGFTYQVPRSGKACGLTTLHVIGAYHYYSINKMLKKLDSGKVYCVRFYINIANNSTCGTDGFGAYFSSNLIDTINICPKDLSFVSPQVSNSSGNVIIDTLNWTCVQGTFTAVGNECYMVIGNFKNDLATATQPLVSSPSVCATDICIDDVSCLPIDLSAYAGPDKPFFTGDSVFIGRTPDVGLNEHCTWYQMPNMSTPIGTVAGLYVKPLVTTTYVVRQQLWCSGVKWDTVIVYKDVVGMDEKLKIRNEELKIYPQPANQNLELRINPDSYRDEELFGDFKNIYIYNNLGQLIRREELFFEKNIFVLNTSSLAEGIYSFSLEGENTSGLNRRFVIAR